MKPVSPVTTARSRSRRLARVVAMPVPVAVPRVKATTHAGELAQLQDVTSAAALAFAATVARWFPKADQNDMRTARALLLKFLREGGAFPVNGVEDPYHSMYRIGELLGHTDYDRDSDDAWTARLEAALVLGVACGVQMRELAGS